MGDQAQANVPNLLTTIEPKKKETNEK